MAMRVSLGVLLIGIATAIPAAAGNGALTSPDGARSAGAPPAEVRSSARDRADLAARRRVMGPPLDTGYRPLPARRSTRAEPKRSEPLRPSPPALVLRDEAFGPPLAEYFKSLDALFEGCEALRMRLDTVSDHDRLAPCYRVASEAGDARAMALLGWLHRTAPDGDLRLARHWYERAHAEGHRPAWLSYGLGWLVMHGGGGAPDAPRAHGLLLAAAEAGHAAAMYHVGWNFEEGHGTAADLDAARRWYAAAAATGHAEAMTRLGHLYETGRGVARDLAAARRWYLAAAAGGQADAMYNLGVLAERDARGPADRVAAREWFERAAAAGHRGAASAGEGEGLTATVQMFGGAGRVEAR